MNKILVDPRLKLMQTELLFDSRFPAPIAATLFFMSLINGANFFLHITNKDVAANDIELIKMNSECA